MRTRRYRQLNSPSQNLDSFLDILTNTVGVLMFISLFITVVAVESSTIVTTPLVSNTEKKPRFLKFGITKYIILTMKKWIVRLPF